MDFCPVLVPGCTTSSDWRSLVGWRMAEYARQGGLFYTITELKEAKLGDNDAFLCFSHSGGNYAVVLF